MKTKSKFNLSRKKFDLKVKKIKDQLTKLALKGVKNEQISID